MAADASRSRGVVNVGGDACADGVVVEDLDEFVSAEFADYAAVVVFCVVGACANDSASDVDVCDDFFNR